MNVYITPPAVVSPSLTRVSQALQQYKPGDVTIVQKESDADLVILHVIGRKEQNTKKAQEIIKSGKKYAVIQYAIKSTLNPDSREWYDFWMRAELVWSYYDLVTILAQDGYWNYSFDYWPYGNFYCSPLGVSDDFKSRTDTAKNFLIATSGQSYLTESVRECAIAADDQNIFHLGSEMSRKNIYCKTGISDKELAVWYSQCKYVSGLRRVEGFELPAAEGLLCGARPIMFDRPHYRQWFNDYAIFIEEKPREEVVQSLKNVFSKEYRPVTQEEMNSARKLFDWKIIVQGFWERVL